MSEDAPDFNAYGEEELFAALGSYLLGEGFGAGPQDDDGNRRFGRQWFEDRLDSFREAVCGSRIAAQLTGDFTTDVTAVASLLPLGSDKLLALTVAAIIVRRGVTRFCGAGPS
ncbi:hypothetical protein D7D52_26830 [Nocardia yunnanensis]|uniref:Uncharacterized protein n=1 Tax=Nocardia yunnanensis TaxID=2382165 RepID=A0A386ZJM8_9NOCA|nr:hypothetical protein [Nocardia yunnanensis]AYF76829.1 hypothetical protein D7D52_26830 [Nocardia yunnanensis]